MIDSHCHLTASDFDTDRDTVIERARAQGVTHIVTIADEVSDIAKCQSLAESQNNLFFTAGVHPHHAASFSEADLPVIREACLHPKCAAVGEIGLDYHYMHSPKDTQQRVFETQLVLAKELHKPAVVHCRESVEDLWTIVNHVKPSRIVIHCCTEKWEDVKRFTDAGHFLSFTGIATYPKSDVIRDTIMHCPMDQLMIETDAPFLSPIPHRGKRNEPAFVAEVLRLVASIKGISVEEADRITTKNTVEFFHL
ncbi:MAG: TatD family hydrolase [Candidatus Peribacteraceae bacterium]